MCTSRRGDARLRYYFVNDDLDSDIGRPFSLLFRLRTSAISGASLLNVHTTSWLW